MNILGGSTLRGKVRACVGDVKRNGFRHKFLSILSFSLSLFTLLSYLAPRKFFDVRSGKGGQKRIGAYYRYAREKSFPSPLT